MRNRILLVCEVPTPFHFELAETINKSRSGVSMDLWFSSVIPEHRGLHWLGDYLDRENVYFSVHPTNSDASVSLDNLVSRVSSYDAVVSGLPIKLHNSVKLKRSLSIDGAGDIPLILWNEQPMPSSFGLRWAKMMYYIVNFLILSPICLFAIGQRANSIYRKLSMGRFPVHTVPYYQNLDNPGLKKIPKAQVSPIKFIFSGQLIDRNNIESILDAALLLRKNTAGTPFRVIFFGKGPLLNRVGEAEKMYPDIFELNSRPPENWEDRLVPLAEADVLLSPAEHSGWGLTIPEALSLGLPVISTTRVESARYFIKDGFNGFLVGRDARSISKAMSLFLRDPSLRSKMKASCIESSKAGDVSVGSRTIPLLIDFYLSQM